MPQLLKRMIVTNCCDQPLYWHEESFAKENAGWCPWCRKLLFIEDTGHVYLVGEKVF